MARIGDILKPLPSIFYLKNTCRMQGHLYIIDVSQSVKLDHPRALDYLREDCLHVSDFFRKIGVGVMSTRELFDFVVDPSIAEDQIDDYLEKIQEKIKDRSLELTAAEHQLYLQFGSPSNMDSFLLLNTLTSVHLLGWSKGSLQQIQPNVTRCKPAHVTA